VVVGASAKPLLYRGVGMRRRRESEVIGVLTGGVTAYSWTTRDEVDAPPFVSGEELLLVAATQAHNGARAVVAGSWEMLSDAFFDSDVCKFYGKSPAPSGNRGFADAVTRWLYGTGGTLRVSKIGHDLVGIAGQQDTYTVKDTVSYGFTLEELDTWGQWQPFVRDDVQMEFTMLDPYYRLDVPHIGAGRYNVTFMVPDVPGVFSFNLDFHRGGYTHIKDSQQVNVRPPRHNGFERFLPVAYPYYASAISMIAGFFVFSLAFLYTE
jgi:oligosaccharyltransferase complex subunit beta